MKRVTHDDPPPPIRRLSAITLLCAMAHDHPLSLYLDAGNSDTGLHSDPCDVSFLSACIKSARPLQRSAANCHWTNAIPLQPFTMEHLFVTARVYMHTCTTHRAWSTRRVWRRTRTPRKIRRRCRARICQKRPISVKRDPYLSKETHICVL